MISGGLGTLFLGLLGWWSKTRIDLKAQKAAESEQTRLDFVTILEPLQEELKDIRTRVNNLEADVRAERDLRERVVGYARSLYWAWKQRFPDHQPPRPPDSIETYFN